MGFEIPVRMCQDCHATVTTDESVSTLYIHYKEYSIYIWVSNLNEEEEEEEKKKKKMKNSAHHSPIHL